MWVALILHNYYIRGRPHDLQNTLSGHVSSFWRGVLKASMAFTSGIKIEVRDGCSIKFCLDRWVDNDTLSFIFPNLFVLTLDPFTIVNTQTYLCDEKNDWAPQFRK